MPFHFSAYMESMAAVTASDVNAVDDTVFQSRNTHLMLSEGYNLLATYAAGLLLSRLSFGNVALTYRGGNHIRPTHLSDTVPSRPGVGDRRMNPLKLPLNEELTLLATTTGAGPSQVIGGLWIAPPEWSMNLPRADDSLVARATVVIPAGAELTWSNPVAIVMERDLYNGVYAVVGAQVVAANVQAFRFYFPSMRPVNGRQLRPGGLVTNAIGDIPWPVQWEGLGEWGRFNTFELPSVQVLSDAAGGTYDVFLNLLYLGEDQGLLRR